MRDGEMQAPAVTGLWYRLVTALFTGVSFRVTALFTGVSLLLHSPRDAFQSAAKTQQYTLQDPGGFTHLK
jgi:hypothetical protein